VERPTIPPPITTRSKSNIAPPILVSPPTVAAAVSRRPPETRSRAIGAALPGGVVVRLGHLRHATRPDPVRHPAWSRSRGGLAMIGCHRGDLVFRDDGARTLCKRNSRQSPDGLVHWSANMRTLRQGAGCLHLARPGAASRG